MGNEIAFWYTGSYDQAMSAALKMIPKTATNRSIEINRDPFGQQKVVVKFTNNHKYAVIIDPADLFNPVN